MQSTCHITFYKYILYIDLSNYEFLISKFYQLKAQCNELTNK